MSDLNAWLAQQQAGIASPSGVDTNSWLEQQNAGISGNRKLEPLADGTPAKDTTPALTEYGADMGWTEGVRRSFLWGMGPGLVGIEPTGELHKWQTQNPKSAFGADLAGMAVPGIGWFKASSKIPKLEKAVSAAGKAVGGSSSPFASAAAKEIVRFAPFEAGVIATNYFGGDKIAEWTDGHDRGTGSVAFTGALSLGLGGGLAGSMNSLAHLAGNKLKTRGITPGADLSAPTQVQMRQTLDTIESGKVNPEFLDQAYAGVNQLKSRVIKETPAANQHYVKAENATEFDELFKPTKSSVTSSRLDNLNDPKFGEWIEQHMPNNWEAYAQFPRRVRPKAGAFKKPEPEPDLSKLSTEELQDYLLKPKAKSTKNPMDEHLKLLDQGDKHLRWTYLKEEKKFLLARNTGEDSWLIFKTDKPEVFMPREAKFSDAMNRFESRLFGEAEAEAARNFSSSESTILNFGRKVDSETPHVDISGTHEKNAKFSVGNAASKTAAGMENKSYSMGDTRYEVGAAVKGLGEVKRQAGTFIKRYLAPSSMQFAESPAALRIYKLTQQMADHGEYLAQRAILGNPLRAESKAAQFRDNAMGARFKGNGSIADKIKTMGDNDPRGFEALLKTIQSEEGIEWGIRNGLTKDGVEILKALGEADAQLAKDIIAAQKANNVDPSKIFSPKENHFMLSRTWEGQYRTPVYNNEGRLVYVAGGTNPKQSADLAARVAEGEGWHVKDTVHTRAAQDMELMKKLAVEDIDYLKAMQKQRFETTKAADTRVGTFQQREGVEGYKTAYTPDELVSALVGHNARYRRYEAEMASGAMFRNDRLRLLHSEPEMEKRLSARLNAIFGVRSDWDIAVNKVVDASPIGKVLGGDSASRIVQSLSKYTYSVALGFVNMGYATATLGTFMQTAIPQMKYINSLAMMAPERLGKYVSYQPVFSADGKGATMLGSIDAGKIALGAMKEMGKPDDLLHKHLYRAAAEGKTDPRFLAEYVGQGANGLQRFKDIWQGKHPISDTLTEVGSFVPGTTERLSRVHSFTMGHIFYRDIMGVKDPNTLYRLAAEFTDLVQYQYGRSHKPAAFDGPLGQMMGLFKTFISNYIGWMSVYAQEGIKHNNWAPLAWQMGGTAAIGGVGSLPLISVADSIGKAFSENDRGTYESIRNAMGGRDDEWGNYGANLVWNGLPALIGASIQGTVQAPFANPVEDSLRLLTSAQLDQAVKMGKAISLGTESLFKPNLIETGEVQRAFANGFAPRSLVKSAQALQGADLRSMNTGNTLIKDLSYSERVLWGLGLNPVEVTGAFETFRSHMNTKEGKTTAMQRYSDRAADAILNGDSTALKRVVTEASLNGMSGDTLMKSVRGKISAEQNDMFTQHFDKQTQYQMYKLGLTH